jgi:hypothetical protein
LRRANRDHGVERFLFSNIFFLLFFKTLRKPNNKEISNACLFDLKQTKTDIEIIARERVELSI